MFKFKGITIYTDEDIAEAGESLTSRIPGTRFHLSAWVTKATIYDLCLTTYDTAVPQTWFEKQLQANGRAPDAVWCYDPTSFGEPMFGKPVFWSHIFATFGDDLNKYVLEHGVESLEAECANE